MDLTLIADIRYITLTSFDYNIIRSITKDKILLQVDRELTESGKNLPRRLWKESVVLTDTEEGIGLWSGREFPVIAWSHEKNKGEKLTGTPWLILSLEALSCDYMKEVWHRCHGIPLEILRTKRCVLRELSMEDLPDLICLDADQDQASPGRFFKGEGSEEDYLSSYIRWQYPFFGYGMYAAFEKEEGEFLGIAGFSGLREDTDPVKWTRVVFGKDPSGQEGLEIGYAVKKSARQKGYAKEWIRELTGYAHRVLNMDTIIARIPSGHRASIAAAVSAGGKLLLL